MSSYSYHDRLIIAHAVFACLTVLIMLPTSLIISRYLRADPKWFTYHWMLNSIAAVFLVIVFALGTRAVVSSGNGSEFTGEGADTHHQLGLAILILVLFQGAVGHLSHYTRGPVKNSNIIHPSIIQSRSPIRYFHILYGIVIAVLLYYQVYSGFDEWNSTSDAGTKVPKSVKILYWILLAAAALTYGVGWVKEIGYAKEYKRLKGT